jgi:hypothetical protein
MSECLAGNNFGGLGFVSDTLVRSKKQEVKNLQSQKEKGHWSEAQRRRDGGGDGAALDVVLVRAVGLQCSGGVGEVLVSYEHGESDAESESSHDEQKLQVGQGVRRVGKEVNAGLSERRDGAVGWASSGKRNKSK